MNRISISLLLILAPGLALCLALLGLETLGDNFTGWILLCLGVACTAGFLIDWHAHQGEPAGESAGERGNLSLWLLLPGVTAVWFAPPLEWMTLGPTLPRTPGWQQAGGLLCACGLGLAAWARLSARSSHSTRLAVLVGQVWARRGVYRAVRHPAQAALLLMGIGVAVGYSSAIGLASAVLLLAPGLVYRMRVEERLLSARFGDAYAHYVRRTRRLIPGLW